MIEQNLNQVTLSTAALKKLKDQRDQEIVDIFKQTQSIAETRKILNNAYTRDVVRLAIFKAGIYDKNTRLKITSEKAKNKVYKKDYNTRFYSREFKLEVELQKSIENLLTKHQIFYKSEHQIPGSQMRADFTGNNWIIETKVNTDSQSMLTGISQCLIYSKKLNKSNKALVIPDDIEATNFFKTEYQYRHIKIIRYSKLIKWLKEINGYR
jgi:hypothetical protein